jgi:hypothetical protein
MTQNEYQTQFYQQLYKSLDDASDDENELCQITGYPLDSKCVTLECKHKFNYQPLYKEIVTQKYVFNSYDFNTLSKKEKKIVKNSGSDFFIRCPYCRNIQFTILPYYEELGLSKKYGINSLEIIYKPSKISSNMEHSHDDIISTYSIYGKLFQKGICDENGCPNKYVATINFPNELNKNSCFCVQHYKHGLNKFKIWKAKQKQEMIDKKQEMIDKKQEMLNKLNEERVTKGLKPLMRLPTQKKQNIVQQGIQVGTYVPDTETDTQELTKMESHGCKALLKTGPNKGKPCGCKKIGDNGLCKRHQTTANV